MYKDNYLLETLGEMSLGHELTRSSGNNTS